MVLDTMYLCMCQDKETKEDVQMEQLALPPVEMQPPTDNGQTEIAPMN